MRRETLSFWLVLVGLGLLAGLYFGRAIAAPEDQATRSGELEGRGITRPIPDVGKETKPYIEWAAELADGDLIPDATGRGFDARLAGEARLAPLEGGSKAFMFDGSGDNQFWQGKKQNCGLSIAKRLDRAFDELSVEAWVRKDPAGWMPVIYRGSWDENWGFGLYTEWSSGKAVFGHYDHTGHKSGVQSESVVQDGRWHHVAGVMAPKGEGSYVYRIFVDGELDAEQAGSWGVTEAPADSGILMIAYPNSSGADLPFKGELGRVAIHDVALTPAMVKARFEAQRGAFGR